MRSGLERLRDATGALHEAVESTRTMRAACDRLGDPMAHGDYLVALALGVRPLVRALLDAPGAAQGALLPDPAAWDRLDADLADLGRPLPLPGLRPPLPVDAGAAWGRLYVVRGAEAGVAVFARRLAQAERGRDLPLSVARHLASRRGEWPALCAALEALPAPIAERAADGARRDFDFVLASITRWEYEREHADVA